MDISPFIADLPRGRCTTKFESADASGSTSQARVLGDLNLPHSCPYFPRFLFSNDLCFSLKFYIFN